MADILDKFKIEGPSFIAQCVILLVVFAVLNKFAFGPVMQLLLERRQRIGLPVPGRWDEILNSDAATYGGQGRGNLGAVRAEPVPWQGCAQSAEVTLPPLSTIFFKAAGDGPPPGGKP